MAHRILVADDEAASRRGLRTLLRNAGYEVEEAADGQEALEKASTFLPAVVISDLVMPRLDGLALLTALQETLPWASVIILTGHGSIETAVTAMKRGAYDYLSKPVDVPRLRLLVEKALERGATARELAALRRQVRAVWGSGRLIGASPAMQEVYRLIDLAAPTTAPVLIVGESGTGKELVARRLHELSPRSRGPFVAVNCSAIPETLLESEIFGHERGAFTGALERRAGCFELADGGTLLLDEVAEMAPGTQAKFLRILQDGTVRRLGGKSELQVDVRVIAATNRDPGEAIREGKLREDLYYRLNVVTIAITPLRSRRDDIPLLVEAFIQEFNAKYNKQVRSVDEATLRWLLERPWPGNVRELRNAIERAIIVCDGELIGAHHLPAAVAAPAPPQAAGGEAVVIPIGTSVDEAERQLIVRTLAAAGNNKARAADILGISLKTLHNKLHRYADAE